MSAYRELLELAAKAAGQPGVYQHWSDSRDRLSHGIAPNGSPGRMWWNPLADDGDALRLAVKLRIAVVYQLNAPPELGLPSECAVAQGPARKCFAESGRDEYAATRNAIVSAAAEIGREMLKGGAA